MFFFFFYFYEGKTQTPGETNRISGERLLAVTQVMQRVKAYQEEGIAAWLTERVLEKKLAQIQNARTKKELLEIARPSLPDYSGGRFREGPYHVREEELILWSQASLRAPLNQTGYKRYMELFEEMFPKEAEKLKEKS